DGGPAPSSLQPTVADTKLQWPPVPTREQVAPVCGAVPVGREAAAGRLHRESLVALVVDLRAYEERAGLRTAFVPRHPVLRLHDREVGGPEGLIVELGERDLPVHP